LTIVVPPGRISNVISFVASAWASGWLKLVLIGVVAGGGLLWARLWLNRHDDRIFAQGQERAIAVLEHQYKATWTEKLAEAKLIADAGAEHFKAAEALNAKADARFPVIFAKLDSIQTSVNQKWVVYVEKAGAVPGSELDSTIRAISADPAINPAQ
jgi:hypothetical protein